MAIYKLFVPPQAVGANLVFFDLFNPGAVGTDLQVLSVIPVVQGSTAVTGVVGVDLHLTRTTAVGTGGTEATFEGTSLTAATISALDSKQPLVASLISARLTPSGGATAGAVLAYRQVFTEETNGGTYTQVADMVRALSDTIPGLLVPGGTGIRVVQGSVASAGNIGFDVFFNLTRR